MGEVWTAVIIVLLIVLCVFSVKSYVKKLRHGCCGGSGGAAEKRMRVADRNKEHYPYTYAAQIDGMVCGNCAIRVENALNRMEGVWAVVDLSQKQASIRSKAPLTREIIREAVRGTGYTVLSISGEN